MLDFHSRQITFEKINLVMLELLNDRNFAFQELQHFDEYLNKYVTVVLTKWMNYIN